MSSCIFCITSLTQKSLCVVAQLPRRKSAKYCNGEGTCCCCLKLIDSSCSAHASGYILHVWIHRFDCLCPKKHLFDNCCNQQYIQCIDLEKFMFKISLDAQYKQQDCLADCTAFYEYEPPETRIAKTQPQNAMFLYNVTYIQCPEIGDLICIIQEVTPLV